MLKISNINPMARAVGTMGAIAALVGGITFAALQSNTVALSPNTLTTTSASIAIGETNTCPTGDTTSTPGLNGALTPGQDVSVKFCLDNTSSIPLTLTASIPDNLSGSTAAQNTTLTIDCPKEGTLTATLSSWGPGTFSTPLNAGAHDNCTATATLSNSYSGSGGETIPAFTINFVGNQTTT